MRRIVPISRTVAAKGAGAFSALQVSALPLATSGLRAVKIHRVYASVAGWLYASPSMPFLTGAAALAYAGVAFGPELGAVGLLTLTDGSVAPDPAPPVSPPTVIFGLRAGVTYSFEQVGGLVLRPDVDGVACNLVAATANTAILLEILLELES